VGPAEPADRPRPGLTMLWTDPCSGLTPTPTPTPDLARPRTRLALHPAWRYTDLALQPAGLVTRPDLRAAVRRRREQRPNRR
jgi:hypothetical protein